GDEAAHRMADQHELGVLVARLLAPGVKPCWGPLGEMAGGNSIVTPPVVREVEPVLPVHDIERREDRRSDVRIAVDAPEPWNEVEIRLESGRGDSIAEVVDGGIV